MGRASKEKDNIIIFKCLMGEKVKIMILPWNLKACNNPFNSQRVRGSAWIKATDSPSILPCASLQIKGRLSYHIRSHLGSYFTAASTGYKPDNITSVNSIRSL